MSSGPGRQLGWRPWSIRLDALRRSFWIPAALALLCGLALGLLMPSVDDWLDFDIPLVAIERDTASSLLETIATVVMSVVGISFSVIVVALQLASQQLSPRVLRTFRSDPLSKGVLALLVGTFMYCLAVLARLGAVSAQRPELSVSVALLLAVSSITVFVAFIHQMVRMLQASTVITRIGEDAWHVVSPPYPASIGDPCGDRTTEAARAHRRMEASAPVSVRSERTGFLTAIDEGTVIGAAANHGALIRQCVLVGDFVVRGMPLAEVWRDGDADPSDWVVPAFDLADERSVAYDAAFPVRQLADIALRALSPSLNDPTTAENALGMLADTLVRFAEEPAVALLRVDGDGCVRFVARAPTLDELVRLAFEQVRCEAGGRPVLSDRLLVLLATIRDVARRHGAPCAELERQARLVSSAAQAT